MPEPHDCKVSDRYAGLWKRLALSSPDIPYDAYCPSVKKGVGRRQSSRCQLYFVSMAAVTRHKKGGVCQPQNENLLTDDDVEPTELSDTDKDELVVERDGLDELDEDEAMPVINLVQLLTDNPFMEISLEEENVDE